MTDEPTTELLVVPCLTGIYVGCDEFPFLRQVVRHAPIPEQVVLRAQVRRDLRDLTEYAMEVRP